MISRFYSTKRLPLFISGLSAAALIGFLLVGDDNNSNTHVKHTTDAFRSLQEAAEMEEITPELWPLRTRDMIGLFLATIGLMIAAGGGIGGGGLLVPIYILVLSFAPKQAIPLSNVTVFGGALANLLLNYSKRHPKADRPLISWDLILIMEPLTLAGALIGANLNVLLPDLVIVVSLVILLNLTGYKTFQKALKLYRKEVQGWRAIKPEDDTETVSETSSTPFDIEMRSQDASSTEATKVSTEFDVEMPSGEADRSVSASSGMSGQHLTLVSSSQKQSPHNGDSTEEPVRNIMLPSGQRTAGTEGEDDGFALVELCTNKHTSNAVMLREKVLEEERNPPSQSIVTITTLFAFVLLTNILKGGGALPSPLGIQCDSFGFWFMDALILVATVLVTLYARSTLLQKGQLKAQAQYQYLETDIKWDARSTIVYPAICTLAGMIAGLFGVGGGLVKAPLLLALGVHPSVASATSATMILFTTFTATTSFVAYGYLVWDYGLVCLVIGFCATLVGQLVMNSLIQRTGKTSYIAFCIAGVVLISALTMTIEWAVTIVDGTDRQSSGFCHSE